MTAIAFGQVLVGLVLLVVGGEFLVRGASALATRLGISPLTVGLTIVSVATSAPELAVSLGAAVRGETELAVGNVVGSNIANILLILGVAALIMPLVVKIQLLRVDIPFMTALSVVAIVLAIDGNLNIVDGLVLLALYLVHLVYSVIAGRRSSPEDVAEIAGSVDAVPMHVGAAFGLIILGVATLVGGSQLLVAGAITIAAALGVSGLVIGLTIVAVGTSLPELAAAIVAVRHGERDLAVGNVVGSNIANIGLVLGLPAIISGEGIVVPHAAIVLDMPLMIAVSSALLPVAVMTGLVITRWEGLVFVGLYVAYLIYVVLAAIGHGALGSYTLAMAWFVLPLVGFTLVASLAKTLIKRQHHAD